MNVGVFNSMKFCFYKFRKILSSQMGVFKDSIKNSRLKFMINQNIIFFLTIVNKNFNRKN